MLKRYRMRLALTTSGVFSAFWLLLATVSTLQTESLLTKLEPVRPINVYLIEDPAYPSIDAQTQMESIAVALQSFEAHFGVRISKVNIQRDALPPIVKQKFPDLWSNPQRSSLAYWESRIFPKLVPHWEEVSSEPLPVLFTNIPIINDLGSDTGLETAHLNPWGLVSGLGHPSLSIISTYRMLREENILFGKAKSENDSSHKRLQARFMGEYVFAHELGHALLGLSDFVHHSRVPALAGMRGPASIDSDNPDYARCLMHTDPGGGYQAWNAIRSSRVSTKGSSNPCPEYLSVLTAFKLRAQALEALNKGERDKAESLYTELLKVYNPPAKNWLRAQWEQEGQLFTSFIQRWWSGFFMIKSSS